MVDFIKHPFLYVTNRPAYWRLRVRRRDMTKYRKWLRRGKPVPPPHIAKQMAIREHARRYGAHVLVETGTFRGEMVDAMLDVFDRIYSIEIAPALFEAARERFAPHAHVEVILGDSTAVLPDIVKRLCGTALFWLDGHYSGGITGKGALETPIVSELKHILARQDKAHAILIDDARCFGGEGDYPTVERLQALVQSRAPGYELTVQDDIIRIVPGAAGH